MDMSGMAMGSMSMGGMAPLIEFPKYYWAVVGTAIGVATVVNIFNNVLYRQRLAAARAGSAQPAKPKSLLMVSIATTFALAREASNFSVRIPIKNSFLRSPTIGRVSLILANIVVLLVLCFYGFDLNDRWSRENIGYRCGFVTIAQFPLIFLLAGKNNLVGYATGISHERLNWLHRWCARCLLLTATIHMGYFFADWAPYDYIGTQLRENTLVWKGIVAWAVLVWMVFSSMSPIRGWSYEMFVLQHLVSFAVLIGFVYIHTPVEVHVYIWVPVALWWFDRVVRVLRVLYANISWFHPLQRKNGQMSGFWACKAEFTPLPHKTTRIVIRNPPISWTPGQHVFLSCHTILPLQSHPFTIASIPEDGMMEFLIKAENGGTKHLFKHAEKFHGILATSDKPRTKTVAIEGPYGALRPLRQFDSVVLLAGSTGATFTVPLLRDILQGWKENTSPAKDTNAVFKAQKGAVTRHVRFVWVVKSRGQLGWFAEQLSSMYSDFQALQTILRHIKLEVTVYVTCDETFTEEHRNILSTITASRQSKHGLVEIRSQSPSLGEKEKLAGAFDEITEIKATTAKPCGPNGTCCCKTTVDETSPDNIQTTCTCRGPSDQASIARPISNISSTPSSTVKPLVHTSFSVFAGRPNPRDIIRRSLEQAWGESAVVVCGPRGLVADVKQDVCSLSDERAVHKGTGAQDNMSTHSSRSGAPVTVKKEAMVAALAALPIHKPDDQLTNPHTQADATLESISEPESTPQFTPESTPETKPSASPATSSFDHLGKVVFVKLEDGFGNVAERELDGTVPDSGTKTVSSEISGHASDVFESIQNLVPSHTVRRRAASPKPMRAEMGRVGGGTTQDNALPTNRLGPFGGIVVLAVVASCIGLIYEGFCQLCRCT
ncbi:ferric-chelate reductase Frp1 [Didymosphaeria variabile]|uniref:ferric-chelate reductase (NADPH) n=1 Tax=Didymosphaeria variabile TaxID=1932322 RepID=A0A9W9CCS0_9PLEO|nr:ferric-chelate reductase Frp1 [Didymosphaeria variabile]KAJ4355975.1 ferric-chelate reductase Frp1 [Didymosphaeria variabile]